jgi:hypothetical protein
MDLEKLGDILLGLFVTAFAVCFFGFIGYLFVDSYEKAQKAERFKIENQFNSNQCYTFFDTLICSEVVNKRLFAKSYKGKNEYRIVTDTYYFNTKTGNVRIEESVSYEKQ